MKQVHFLRYFNNLDSGIARAFCIVLCLSALLLHGQARAQTDGFVHTIVIDAGHGGHDPGALGSHTKEKNVNLAIALKLGKMIREGVRGVKVIFTRDDDTFVELYRRAGIANEAKADLFISIHCNANKNPSLKGAETYVMGLHKSQANLNIAKLENASILLEPDYQSSYNGFDPNSDESYIIFSLNQNSNLDKSTDFAAEVQKQMEERVGMNNRGVRQAGFMVLYKTTMPSVLIETGYISNSDEEKFLNSESGQQYIASAIFRAFRQIAQPGAASETSPGGVSQPDTGHARPPKKADTVRQKAPPKPKPVVKTPKEQQNAPPDKGTLSYRVQISAEAKELSVTDRKFARFQNVKMYRHGGMYKYTVGDEPDLASVLKVLEDVKQKGVKDAFVVIFRNGERVPQADYDRLMRK